MFLVAAADRAHDAVARRFSRRIAHANDAPRIVGGAKFGTVSASNRTTTPALRDANAAHNTAHPHVAIAGRRPRQADR
ncbi:MULTISPECIES: hypothetical protein [Lysobacter]|uniref:Uncharacterized protein n=1 Tax=Lysobacter firmicutimachus TaxID=1792846 RepID=A0ABU8CZ95_9GAMM|nr:hypothetical protein [Lysobacter antibioticus]